MRLEVFFALHYAWAAVEQDSDPETNRIAFDVAVSFGIVFG